MKKTYIYALDLSLNSTGICLFTNDGRFVKSLTIDTHSKKETKLKLSMIGIEFLNLIKQYPPSIIVIEQGFSLFNASTQALFKVHGLINYLFAQYEQVYYPASTVKKVITGKGNAKKEEVRDAIIKNYSITFNNLDESDAFGTGMTYFIKKGLKWAEKHLETK